METTTPTGPRSPSLDLNPATFRLEGSPGAATGFELQVPIDSGRIDHWNSVALYADGTYEMTVGYHETSYYLTHGHWTRTDDVFLLVDDHGAELKRIRRSEGGLGFSTFSWVEDEPGCCRAERVTIAR